MHVPNVEAPTAEERNDYPAYPEPLHTGNVHDDDATVFDQQLQENPEPGLPFPSSPGEAHPPVSKKITRLITGTLRLLGGGGANAKVYKMLNADPNRLDLWIYANGVDTATKYLPVQFASDSASFGVSNNTVFQVSAGQLTDGIRLPCHTGEIYVYYPGTANPPDAEISWVATTI
jgi:hypothetical protein